MKIKTLIILVSIGAVLALTVWAAPAVLNVFGQTLGMETEFGHKVFVEPNLMGQVNSHHQIDIPAGPFPVVQSYDLKIDDLIGKTVPTSNDLNKQCYELTDISVAIDPRAFKNYLGLAYNQAYAGKIGLRVDVFTSNGSELSLNDRACVTWRCEGHAGYITDGCHGSTYFFDADPVTFEKHFQTPILIAWEPTGTVQYVHYRVTFIQETYPSSFTFSSWETGFEDGVNITFSGRFRKYH